MSYLKDKIVFESFSDFSDNTRTLFDYMIKNKMNKKYEMIWLVEEPKKFENIKINNVSFSYVEPNRKEQYSHMENKIRDAKFLIGSNRNIKKYYKEQIYINLWHGTLLKQLNDYKIDNKDWDYLLCPSEFFSNIYERELRIPKEKLIYYNNPRNDDLWRKSSLLRNIYSQDDYKKFILWMPTYRQHRTGSNIDSKKEFNFGIPIINTNEELENLDRILEKEKCMLVIKIHPAQDLSKIRVESIKNIKILKNTTLEEKDIKLYNLLAEADALITDYSSVYFDYMILDRPIGFTIDDIDEYKGFAFENPLEYMPGDHIKNYEELEKFIFKIAQGIDEYKENRNTLNLLFNKFRDNQNSKRIIEFLKL